MGDKSVEAADHCLGRVVAVQQRRQVGFARVVVII